MRRPTSFPVKFTPSWLAGFCVLGALVCAGSARATIINVTNVAVPLSVGGITITDGTNSFSNAIAGQIALTASVLGGIPGSFVLYAWCVDFYHDIYLGQNSYAYTVAGGVVSDDGNGTALSPAVSSKLMTLAAYGNTQLAGAKAGDANFSSAVQLAIWKTEYAGFAFTANTSVTNYVTSLQTYAANNSAPATSLRSLSGAQNLITDSVGLTFSGNSGGTAIPEPAATGLIGVGVLALVGMRRRRSK